MHRLWTHVLSAISIIKLLNSSSQQAPLTFFTKSLLFITVLMTIHQSMYVRTYKHWNEHSSIIMIYDAILHFHK
jgi:hypothetical protein